MLIQLSYQKLITEILLGERVGEVEADEGYKVLKEYLAFVSNEKIVLATLEQSKTKQFCPVARNQPRALLNLRLPEIKHSKIGACTRCLLIPKYQLYIDKPLMFLEVAVEHGHEILHIFMATGSAATLY